MSSPKELRDKLLSQIRAHKLNRLNHQLSTLNDVHANAQAEREEIIAADTRDQQRGGGAEFSNERKRKLQAIDAVEKLYNAKLHNPAIVINAELIKTALAGADLPVAPPPPAPAEFAPEEPLAEPPAVEPPKLHSYTVKWESSETDPAKVCVFGENNSSYQKIFWSFSKRGTQRKMNN